MRRNRLVRDLYLAYFCVFSLHFSLDWPIFAAYWSFSASTRSVNPHIWPLRAKSAVFTLGGTHLLLLQGILKLRERRKPVMQSNMQIYPYSIAYHDYRPRAMFICAIFLCTSPLCVVYCSMIHRNRAQVIWLVTLILYVRCGGFDSLMPHHEFAVLDENHFQYARKYAIDSQRRKQFPTQLKTTFNMPVYIGNQI